MKTDLPALEERPNLRAPSLLASEARSRPRPGRVAAPLSLRASTALGVISGVITAGVYFLGANRSLGDIDGSVTVAAFIKSPSILDALRRTPAPPFNFNDHPLFSVIEHSIWSAGFHSEAALRVVPIVFAALAVGLLAAACGRSFGLIAGICAGAILAANPLFAFQARELRGYSMLVFCAVASTILLLKFLLVDHPRRLTATAYVVVIAAGAATHLWFSFVLIVHLAIVIANHRFSLRWAARWVIGLGVASLFYVRSASKTFFGAGDALSHWHLASGAPTKAARALLGHQPVALVLIGGVLVFAALQWAKRRDVVIPLLITTPLLVVVWLLWPQYLAPRFLVWIIPVIAVGVAAAVSRVRWLAIIVLIALCAMVADQYATWTDASPNLAEAAALIDGARAMGLHVCGYKSGQWGVLAYTSMPAPIVLQGPGRCDVAVAMRYPETSFDKAVQTALPNQWSLPGHTPIRIFSRVPISQLRAAAPARSLPLDAHPETFP